MPAAVGAEEPGGDIEVRLKNDRFDLFLAILIVVVGMIALSSCSARTGTVTKTPTGIVFDMEADGKMTYKDAEVEASMDMRKKAGIIEDIISLYTIKMINEDN